MQRFLTFPGIIIVVMSVCLALGALGVHPALNIARFMTWIFGAFTVICICNKSYLRGIYKSIKEGELTYMTPIAFAIFTLVFAGMSQWFSAILALVTALCTYMINSIAAGKLTPEMDKPAA